MNITEMKVALLIKNQHIDLSA